MENLVSNASGYNIIEISEDSWIFQVVDGECSYGTFREILLFAILRHGFSLSELEEATDQMIEDNCTAAHFGTMKTFIYSFNYKFVSERKAI